MLKRPGGKTYIGYPYDGDSIRMDRGHFLQPLKYLAYAMYTRVQGNNTTTVLCT